MLRLLGSLRFEVMTRPGILVDDHWRNANPCSGAHGVSVFQIHFGERVGEGAGHENVD